MAGRGTPQSRARQWLVVRKKSFHQEQGVEHDRFGEGNGQNRLDQDFRRGAGIAADSFRSLHTDETNARGRAKCCQTYVQVPAQFCQQRHHCHICFLSFFLVGSRD